MTLLYQSVGSLFEPRLIAAIETFSCFIYNGYSSFVSCNKALVDMESPHAWE